MLLDKESFLPDAEPFAFRKLASFVIARLAAHGSLRRLEGSLGIVIPERKRNRWTHR